MGSPAVWLRNERAIIGLGIAVLVAIAWAHVWQGAGMGMSALHMTTLSLFPHLAPDLGGSMDAPWWVVLSMWWVMMVAMMTPSAAPLVLLYATGMRKAFPPRTALAGALLLLAGYLLAWLGFSLAATAAQRVLEARGWLSEMMLWSRSAVLSAAVLGLAGLYQFTPLKSACLSQCRAPARYLAQHWRPGTWGSLGLGMRHGTYCVGCCWLLMALLFVGGVMNLVWLAVLAALVAAEKLLPAGPRVAQVTGGLLLVWAAVTLLV